MYQFNFSNTRPISGTSETPAQYIDIVLIELIPWATTASVQHVPHVPDRSSGGPRLATMA